MQYSKVCFQSFGYELPPNVVSSADIELQLQPVYQKLKLPEGRLELMSGIKERRFWDKGTKPSDGASLAGKKALDNAGLQAGDIDCLIFTSVCRDMMEPATAAFVHNNLGLAPHCQIFDISNACLGFLNGLTTLANMIELGQVKRGLVVAGETAEDLVQSTIDHLLNTPYTRKTIKPVFASLTIGSGAVAAVLTDKDLNDTGHYLLGGAIQANTAHNNLCKGNNDEGSTLMATDSETLLLKGVETAHLCWPRFLAELNWQVDDIDHFFCHQVGKAHAELLFKTLEIEFSKNYQTLPILGNVGSVSAPITLAMALDKGGVGDGDKGAILGIGSGINSLMLGVQW